MHGKRDRRIGDRCLSVLTDEKQDISDLLGYIHGFYREALDLLPIAAIPSLVPRLLKAGMPIGFLDPVSNIIANTIAYTPSPTPGSDQEEEAPSSEWISKIITDTNDNSVFRVPLSRQNAHGMTLARRSLDGLVSFLTSHYRYLISREAMSYLLLARADLLTAVRLIEHKRRNVFSITSSTNKVALECAAVSARHPEPDVLVKASLTMASRDVSMLLTGQGPLSPATLESLAELLRQGPTGMDLINVSLDHLRVNEGTCQAAPGRPAQASPLQPPEGGYCYGPRDPVSNIILNTIWYGSMFPTPHKFELQFKVDMICTRMLARIECCSLYGLVTFLRTCAPELTEHDAIWYLFRSGADVHKAIREVKKHGHHVPGNYQDAYMQAAVVSWHDDPDELVKFATSSLNMESAKLLALLQGTLTNDGVECLTMALPHKSPATKSQEQAQQPNQVTSSSQVLSKNQKIFISEFRKKFRRDQNFFVRKVKAVLSDYSQRKVVHYKLHIICDVNPRVPDGPSVALVKKKFQFEYFHINFLATAPNSAVAAPELFFAQCSNSIKEMQERPSWCTPVSDSSIDNARCFSCKFNGAKIVHPCDETYCGCYEDFKLMAHGKHGTGNELLTSSCHSHSDVMATMTQDFIYFYPNMDSKFAEMNPISNVARKLKEWKGRIF
ncbi:LOW QUALITY PROTEIN: hypothetical protein CFC21_112611 [Triticum aestivum]|uniref:Uncharacterized protein n=2 Tax=Triticum aestivum TaxID=4565 RepID=A0A3B6SQD2_WHEAT|nr:hypothetical protein [Triticum aestivum]